MRATARRSARWLSIAVGGPGRRAPGARAGSGRRAWRRRRAGAPPGRRLRPGRCDGSRAFLRESGFSARVRRRRRRTRAEKPDSTCVAARGAPRSAAPRAPPTTPPPATRARRRPTFRDVIYRTCRIEGRGAPQSRRKRSPMSLIEVALTTICCGCQRGWHLHDVLHECGSVVGFGTSVVAPGTRPGGRSGAYRRHDGVGTR